MTLTELKQAADDKESAFHAAIEQAFPGMNEWHWFRALSAIEGRNTRRNDDTANDAALAGNATIREAYDSYITALHTFYRARDGDKGVLGGRGL